MMWNPLLEPSHLAMWQLIIVWAIELPLVFLMFLVLVVTGIMSCNMTEAALKQPIEEAGPFKRFFLTFFVGPTLAILTQAFLCAVIIAAVSDGRRDSRS